MAKIGVPLQPLQLLQPLPHRTIQIGLSKEAVTLYVNQWVRRITDVTPLAHEVHALVQDQQFEEAKTKLPTEQTYSPRLSETTISKAILG
nr:DUF4291 family protein [uncultured Deefgea sp.]